VDELPASGAVSAAVYVVLAPLALAANPAADAMAGAALDAAELLDVDMDELAGSVRKSVCAG